MARVCIMLAGLADVYGYEKKRNRKRKEQNYSNFGALLDQFWSKIYPSRPILGLSWESFGPVWGYLWLLEAILGHVGRIWGPRASKIAPSKFARAPTSPIWLILEGVLDPKICYFLDIFGVMFWTSFWTLFGSLLGQFWSFFLGPDGPKRGQDGL